MSDASPPPVRLRVVSWNIGLRGLRNLLNDLHGNSLRSVFALVGEPDILCLQETKVSRADLARIGDTAVRVPGIFGFFAFNKKGTGYSGVATYCKACAMPVAAGSFTSSRRLVPRCWLTHWMFVYWNTEEGLSGALVSEPITGVPEYPLWTDDRTADGSYTFSLTRLESEGRCVITDHKVIPHMK